MILSVCYHRRNRTWCGLDRVQPVKRRIVATVSKNRTSITCSGSSGLPLHQHSICKKTKEHRETGKNTWRHSILHHLDPDHQKTKPCRGFQPRFLALWASVLELHQHGRKTRNDRRKTARNQPEQEDQRTPPSHHDPKILCCGAETAPTGGTKYWFYIGSPYAEGLPLDYFVITISGILQKRPWKTRSKKFLNSSILWKRSKRDVKCLQTSI